jgi:hypothetical protein
MSLTRARKANPMLEYVKGLGVCFSKFISEASWQLTVNFWV